MDGYDLLSMPAAMNDARRMDDHIRSINPTGNVYVMAIVLDGAPETLKCDRGLARRKCQKLQRRILDHVSSWAGCRMGTQPSQTKWFDGDVAWFAGAEERLFDAAVAARDLHADLHGHNQYCRYSWIDQVHARIALAETVDNALGILHCWGFVDRDETVINRRPFEQMPLSMQHGLRALGVSPSHTHHR